METSSTPAVLSEAVCPPMPYVAADVLSEEELAAQIKKTPRTLREWRKKARARGGCGWAKRWATGSRQSGSGSKRSNGAHSAPSAAAGNRKAPTGAGLAVQGAAHALGRVR